METVTPSTKVQLVRPRRARERRHLHPGMRLAVIDKGGVIFLVPERRIAAVRGVAAGANQRDFREKKDRL